MSGEVGEIGLNSFLLPCIFDEDSCDILRIHCNGRIRYV